jgi:hypothetical protein
VGETSLYPSLCRLLIKGWVKAEWGASLRRQAKVIHLRSPKVTHTENTVWNRILPAGKNERRYHPRRRRAVCLYIICIRLN